MVKAMVQRKKGAWKEILGARDNVANERCMEACKKEKINVKRCIYQNKKNGYEQSVREMDQDVRGNRKLFWKEVIKLNGGKGESCNIIEGNGRLALEEVEVR